MTVPNRFALGKEQKCFAVLEAVYGVLAVPGAAHQLMILNGGSVSVQAAELLKNDEVRDSRDDFGEIKGKSATGDFNFSLYSKPSGVAGTAPDGAEVFEAALGVAPATLGAGLTCLAGSTASVLKVVTGAITAADIGDLVLINGDVTCIQGVTVGAQDDVTVSPALSAAPNNGDAIGRSVNFGTGSTLKSLSVYFKDGHSVFSLAGCVVEELGFKIGGKEISGFEIKGNYARMRITGTDEVGVAAVADGIVTAFPVADCAKFEEGSRFSCGNEVNILVSSKDAQVGPGILTVVRGTGAEAHVATDETIPWLPTGSEVGEPVHGRMSKMTVAGTELVQTSASINLKNGNTMVDEECGQDYASDFIPGSREISGSTKLFFRTNTLHHFRNAQNLVNQEVMVIAGKVAGKIVVIYMPKAALTMPAISGSDKKELDIPLKGYAINGNDAFRLGFL